MFERFLEFFFGVSIIIENFVRGFFRFLVEEFGDNRWFCGYGVGLIEG